jgi:hypothetical protein
MRRTWVPIAFAVVVSEVVPMSTLLHLPESSQQMSFQLEDRFGLSSGITAHSMSGVFALTVAYFPVLTPLVVLAAFCAYLAVTRTLTLRGFLCGVPTALCVLIFGFMGVISFLVFSGLHLPQPIFYYVVLRLPMFFGLVLALWVAHDFHFHSSVHSPSTQRAGA